MPHWPSSFIRQIIGIFIQSLVNAAWPESLGENTPSHRDLPELEMSGTANERQWTPMDANSREGAGSEILILASIGVHSRFYLLCVRGSLV